jgi:hypothetical protein
MIAERITRMHKGKAATLSMEEIDRTFLRKLNF